MSKIILDILDKEKILDIVESIPKHKSITAQSCNQCELEKYCAKNRVYGMTCIEILENYLKSEVKMKSVKRFELIKSNDDLDNIYEDFVCDCGHKDDDDCLMCCYREKNRVLNKLDCFNNYLKEEIEIFDF